MENGVADIGDGTTSGDLIQWILQIHNTGTVALHDVTFHDPLLGGTIAGPAVFNPGDFGGASINYFLTADDVAAHHVLNEATVTALDPMNNLITVMAHYDQLLPH